MSLAKVSSAALALGLLAMPVAAAAQQPAKVHRIGFLSQGSSSGFRHFWEAFRQGLRELGYVEGRNIALESRWAEGRFERLPDLAAELARLKVDVILAGGTPSALAAKNATRTIPIVMVNVADPVRAGLVASLARPGGNITGPTLLNPELSAKRVELLKEVVPKVSRVAAFMNPASPATPVLWEETQRAAEALGVQLQPLEVRGPNEYEGAFGAATRGRAGGLLFLDDAVMLANRTRIVTLAARSSLPGMYGFREFVDVGGLMSYGANASNSYGRAATYVDKILKGAKPADLPVEQPTRFELVINMKTAKALGLTIPQTVLIRAEHVIQ